jgi:tetratricopeptide (TPR) repeat protein
VDKSLVRHAEDRFWMLETIREYALERMEAGEAEDLRRRHAVHFLALAEEAEPHLSGHEGSSEWLDRLLLDYDNLRGALDHLHLTGEGELELRLAGTLWVFWRDRAYFAEGRRRLESALGAQGPPTPARGKALIAAASLATLGGDPATGRRLAEAALFLHRSLGDQTGIGQSEMWLGWALANEGEWGAARPLFENSVRRSTDIGDEDSRLIATMFLAMACAELGDRQRARGLDEENLERARRIGHEQIEATTLDGLARHALDEGRLDEGLARAVESLRLYHKLGDPHGVAIELRRSAYAIALKGNANTAVRLLAAAEVLHGEIGGTMSWVARMTKGTLASIREQLDQSAFEDGWRDGGKLTADEAVALAASSMG